jgi:hypothetical protein
MCRNGKAIANTKSFALRFLPIAEKIKQQERIIFKISF